MLYGWQFPINAQGGQREGLNNHGMESFKDDKFNHLPREVIQNSLDAAKDKVSKVTVEFTRHTVKTEEIPDVNTLKGVFRNLMDEESDEKYHHFYSNAHQVLNQDEISIMKISDYGTTGLLGVKNSSDDWDSLIFNSGSSYKKIGSGGTYGLGKNAPFLLSNLYTIIYSTITNEDVPAKGLIGVSKLASHYNDSGEITRGVGYFRNKENYKIPYIKDDVLPELINRNESGTDILVLGFTDEDNWVDKIVKSVLNNFFIRILEGTLEVKVDNILIDSDSLEILFAKYKEDNFKVADYYEAYTNKSNNCYRTELKIQDLGKIKLTVFLDDSNNRKVYMARNQGMLIKYLTRFSRIVNFTAVGVVEGEELDDILRQCEPPAHDDWNAEFYRGEKSTKEVNALLKEMRSEIRNYINSFEKLNQSEEIVLEDLSDVLGYTNPTDDPTQNIEEDDTGLTKVARLKLQKNKPNGGQEEVFDPKGNKTKKSKKRKKYSQGNNGDGRKTGTSKEPMKNKVTVQTIRVLGNPQSKEYIITFIPMNTGTLRLSIKQEGMNGTKYTDMFNQLERLDVQEKVGITSGVTDQLEVTKNERVKLKLKLKDSRMSMLEVKIHEG